jgi:hypothetical protein
MQEGPWKEKARSGSRGMTDDKGGLQVLPGDPLFDWPFDKNYGKTVIASISVIGPVACTRRTVCVPAA